MLVVKQRDTGEPPASLGRSSVTQWGDLRATSGMYLTPLLSHQLRQFRGSPSAHAKNLYHKHYRTHNRSVAMFCQLSGPLIF
jgi:hypothetical protein